jgi:two-component system cell cycle sensor histidine kinase/response regulator CckA
VEARDSSFFRALFEKSADAICLIAADGRILHANRSTERILDYPPSSLSGVMGWGLIHPDDHPAAAAALARLLAEPGASVAMERYRVRHRDGSWRWVETVATNLLDEPAVGAIVANYRDVTDRVRLEEELRQAQKLEAVGLLAGGVAHDFNNLLTVILASTEHARLALAAGDPALPDLEHIGQAALAARDVTEKLLAFTPRPSGSAAVFDLGLLVAQARGLLTRVAGPDVTVELVAPDDPLPIEGYPAQLQQVLVNLCLNARQAMPAGGRLRIAASRLAPDRCLLVVADTGTGMDPPTLARLYEPFFTTRPGGTGQGMVLVAAAVRDHRGSIDVETRPGAGTTFRIALPLAATPAPPPRSAPVLPAGGTETLLLAEDEPRLRDVLTRTLRRLGYTVLTAADGQEALELFTNEGPRIALVILDVIMPRLGGEESFAAMSAQRPDLRAVFISGYAPETTHLGELLATGRALLLQKPFLGPELDAAVRAMLAAGA